MIKAPEIFKVTQPINAYSDVGEMLKAVLHKEGKRFLREVAKELGLDRSEYDLRNNLAGIAVSGEVTLHTDKVYIQSSDSSLFYGIQILYRVCNGRKDYCGGQNHFINTLRFFEEPDALEEWLSRIKRMQYPSHTGSTIELAA